VNKAISLSQPIKPHASPSSQIVLSDLIIPDGEAHPRELIHDVGDGGKVETLAAKVGGLAAVSSRAGLVLAFALVAVVGDGAAVKLIRALDVQLDLDVGLEAAGGCVTRREGDVLGGEDGDGEVEGLAGDGIEGSVILIVVTLASVWSVSY
jgi:hypothetical protein